MPSVSREWRLYLADMVEACGRIGDYTKGMERTAFLDDRRTCDATLWDIVEVRVPQLREQLAALTKACEEE